MTQVFPGVRGAYAESVFFNLGLAEIAVIAVLGLLIFGPDKLPRAVQTLTSGVRTLRASASDATRSLQDAAGWDDAETKQTLSDIADLHPKRLMGSILSDAAPDTRPTRAGRKSPDAVPDTASLTDFDPDAP